jgi:hypothetical protein
MRNWQHIIKRHHEWAHKNDGYSLVTRLGANLANIKSLESSIGFQLPAEFHSLYLTYDGVGVCADPGKIYWRFQPLAEIPGFIESVRDWFKETHPDVAGRFFPFIDWSSGDFSGYLLSPSGTILPGLYDFDHEEYEFDEAQEVAKFISSSYLSIEDVFAK